jgi:xylulokinase
MLLVVDIGTSAFKAAVTGYDGSGGRFVSLPLEYGPARKAVPGADPAQWLRAFEEAAARFDAGSLAAVEAVIISGNGPTLAPVTGTPALTGGSLSLPSAEARLWLDRRAEEEARTVSRVMGGFVDGGFFLPKALAVKNREPELYEKTKWFLAAPEYLACALTGEARTVIPSEGFERWYWNDRALEVLGLDKEKFPPRIMPGELIGAITGTAAARFGFKPAVKVIAGGPDFFASILGTGAVRPGRVCDRSGTSEGINLCCSRRIDDPHLMCYGHPVRPYWNLSGIVSTTGGALAWGRELLGMTGLPYAAFLDLAASSPAGAGGLVFLPYLAGERAPVWDPHARGVFLGLSLETGREETARAIAEGTCFAIRDVLTVMEETGAPVEELRTGGKPGESVFLNQLKADITGRPVLAPRAALSGAEKKPETLSGETAFLPAELRGLAALGAAALGAYASVEEAVRNLTGSTETFFPREENRRVYDDAFGTYRETYRALKPLFKRG